MIYRYTDGKVSVLACLLAFTAYRVDLFSIVFEATNAAITIRLIPEQLFSYYEYNIEYKHDN